MQGIKLKKGDIIDLNDSEFKNRTDEHLNHDNSYVVLSTSGGCVTHLLNMTTQEKFKCTWSFDRFHLTTRVLAHDSYEIF